MTAGGRVQELRRAANLTTPDVPGNLETVSMAVQMVLRRLYFVDISPNHSRMTLFKSRQILWRTSRYSKSSTVPPHSRQSSKCLQVPSFLV
jgi:hypothetical protein